MDFFIYSPMILLGFNVVFSIFEKNYHSTAGWSLALINYFAFTLVA